MQVEKTVFICYRRTNKYHAIAVYQALTHRGYDVFLDYESIDSGSFERAILNQIDARAHFLILLTPSTLERCVEPNDWVRREIERAIEMKRNIVPLMFDSFEFGYHENMLTGPLTLLPMYQGLRVYGDYFDEAIERLCNRYLNAPLDLVLHPTPPDDKEIVERKQAQIATVPTPTSDNLSAEQYFASGLAHQENRDLELAIAAYTEAIRINPEDEYAYNNRGFARQELGDLVSAIADYTEAIRLNPQYTRAYNNRGFARQDLNDLNGAISDWTEAIRITPNDARIYSNRGAARADQHDFEGAIADYTEAIRINPDYGEAYYNRGTTRAIQGELDGAIADFHKVLRINPDHQLAHHNLEVALRARDERGD